MRTDSRARHEFEKLLRALHLLEQTGDDQSNEADTLREAMEEHWFAMSESDRADMRDLSSSLQSKSLDLDVLHSIDLTEEGGRHMNRSDDRLIAWSAFQKAGMLWFVNRILHVFGWVIALEIADDGETVLAAYPERTTFKGFPESSERTGYERVERHLREMFAKES